MYQITADIERKISKKGFEFWSVSFVINGERIFLNVADKQRGIFNYLMKNLERGD